MIYKGTVKGNTVVLEKSANLTDGTEVEVIPLNQIDSICGSWHDDRPAEEIIREIRSSRYSRDKKIDL